VIPQFDVRHKLFRPVWSRMLVVGVLAAWTGYEAINGHTIWALVFGAATAYLAYEFFVIFDPAKYGEDEDSS